MIRTVKRAIDAVIEHLEANNFEICSSYCTCCNNSKIQKKRTIWSREWLSRRKEHGCYENLMMELALEDAEGYRRWLRMDTEAFELLLIKVTPLISKQDTNMRKSISAGERLSVTLRYLATGETQSSLSFQFRIGQNTIQAFSLKDLWQFPQCLGALDGKHVQIVPPPASGSLFYNHKGTFSIVLMALVDAELNFVFVDVGTNGRMTVGQLTPPFLGKRVGDRQRIFNYRLFRARRVVENAFGLLAARFQVYGKPIFTSALNAVHIVLATCVVHNFLRKRNPGLYIPAKSIDAEDFCNKTVVRGEWRRAPADAFLDLERDRQRGSQTSKYLRNVLCTYFNETSDVSWQRNMCLLH
ncbi:hypothetical protein JTE90_008668 [Oedothorax gibbosus]|uniref:DDE Tnp4 domain-containing protein n=1 Tax=Oedothorax gibbosus TaxID=931172 RepID=A0AAV6U0L9_9ARAC|nr:hypothetical protein JTE90_008668 [Oedothorax gibbosus]